MQIAICDDNVLHLNELEGQLNTLPLVENVFSYSDLDTFLISIEDGKRYDVVFMDIDLGQNRTGLDVAEELYRLSPESKIIYVTGYNDKFSQHILLRRTNLSGYLTKPVNAALLEANLQKVINASKYQDQPSILLQRRGNPVTIPLHKIFYIESFAHTINVHTVDETITTYERLDNILRSLPDFFYRCHKSYIINMQKIQRFEPNDILLKNGDIVPVSRARYGETKEAFITYMGKTF